MGRELVYPRNCNVKARTVISSYHCRRLSGRAGRGRAELRPVDLKSGRHVQIVTTDGLRPTTRNLVPTEVVAEVGYEEAGLAHQLMADGKLPEGNVAVLINAPERGLVDPG